VTNSVEREVWWKAYVALLSNEIGSLMTIASVHGYKPNPDKLAVAKDLRARLGIPAKGDDK